MCIGHHGSKILINASNYIIVEKFFPKGLLLSRTINVHCYNVR